MMQRIKRLLADRYILPIAILYSCSISVLFFVPGGDLPKIGFSAIDKVAHGLIYFILVNLWLLFFYKKNHFQFDKKWVPILVLSVLLYGIIIEILQGLFTSTRSADFWDVVANLVGSLVGIYFFKMIKYSLKT